MMRVLYVVRHYLRRMLKNRAFVIAAVATPLVCGVLGLVLPDRAASSAFLWVAPVACAAIAWGWVWMLHEADAISGMADAIRNSPLRAGQITASQVAAGSVVYMAQIGLLLAIVAVGR